MAYDDEGDKSYEVGYKRPPRHTQFSPGQSGNPSGRPRGSGTIESRIEEVLEKKVTVRENGEKKQITRKHALAEAIVNDAIRLKPVAVRALMPVLNRLSEKYERYELANTAMQSDEEDHEILRRFLGDHVAASSSQGGENE